MRVVVMLRAIPYAGLVVTQRHTVAERCILCAADATGMFKGIHPRLADEPTGGPEGGQNNFACGEHSMNAPMNSAASGGTIALP